MARGQAWCPRCDEVRRARAGARCPACSATLVALPAAAGARGRTPGWTGPARRLRSALTSPARAARAVRAGAAVAVALALVAGAFVAGRGSGPSGSEPAAAAGAPSAPDSPGGPAASRQLGWSASADGEGSGGVTVRLLGVLARRDFTRVTFEVRGLPLDWLVEGFEGLRVEDGAGRDLAGARLDGMEPAAESFSTGGGSVQAEVEYPTRIDPSAIGRVRIGALQLTRTTAERLEGVVAGGNLEVRCRDCHTIHLDGTSYRNQQVVLLLRGLREGGDEGLERRPRRDEISVRSGDSLVFTNRATDSNGNMVVTFPVRALTPTVAGPGAATRPFTVLVRAISSRQAGGPWRLDPQGGAR